MEAQKPPSRAAWRSRFCARTEWFRLLPGLTRAVAGTLVGLIGFACVEAAIFDSGWYSKYLEPDSTAGQVEYNLFWLRRTWPPKTPDVLVMGDSRIAEAFSARVAGESVNGKIHFMNFGMPGSTPRVWYYTLRDAEKDRNRFSAIVIPFNRYSDFDSGEDLPNRVTDLNFLAARLRWSECGDFSRSYPEADARRSVLTGCLIRGLALREDVRDFLSGIPERLRRTKNWRNNGERYIEGYDGKYEDLKGLTVDTATGKIHFPPGAQDWQIESTRAALRPYTGRQSGEAHRIPAKVDRRDSGFIQEFGHTHHFYSASLRAAARARCGRVRAIYRFREMAFAADGIAGESVPRSGEARVIRRRHARTERDGSCFRRNWPKPWRRSWSSLKAMLFTTLDFVLFLAVVLGLFYILPRSARRYLLLGASLFFYMAWNAKFVVLILGLITVDFLRRSVDRPQRRSPEAHGFADQPVREYRAAGLFQVHQFSARYVPAFAAARYHPAAGNQFSHVPEHLLCNRRVPGRAAGDPELRGLRAVRGVLPATGRRADRAREGVLRRITSTGGRPRAKSGSAGLRSF